MESNRNFKKFIFALLFIFLFLPLVTKAQTETLKIKFDQAAVQKGYTAEFDNKNFRLAVTPGLVDYGISLEMKRYDANEVPKPDNLKLVSDGYYYEIKSLSDTTPIAFSKSLILAVRFNSNDYYLKSIYYWDKNKNAWVELPSSTDYVNHYIRAYMHFSFSRIAVFEDKTRLEGVASWYRSNKYPYGAACNNYPEKTKLKVTNIDNGKSVIVQVVPGQMTHTTRVADLSLTAFKKIAKSSEGLARVRVEPLEDNTTVLGVETKNNQAEAPKINSKAAIIINEKTGEILFSKNRDDILPLASLTKLMTAYIFLETKTPWDKVVAYKAEDNTIGSKIYVSPGETMKVKDLFFSSLVGSANNTTKTLVRSTGLSEQEFINRMNNKAREWGLLTINFVDVTGLDPKNVGSASDYVILAKNVFKSMDMLVATTTKSYTFKTINTQKVHTINNKNKLIGSKWYITGIKTGYLDEAGYCLVAKVRAGKYTSPDTISVLLGGTTDSQRYNEMNKLINYALSIF